MEKNTEQSKWSKIKNWIKNNKRPAIAGVVIVVAALFGYYLSFEQKIVIDNQGDSAIALLDGSIDSSAVNKDGDARINILLMGKGGEGHAGGNLTDTIQVVSLDVFGNEIAMLSIPRDLYVDSSVGSMKINAVYSTANGQKKNSGGNTMKELVSEITDLNIHYFVTVDFDGFYSFIDVLGGIAVDVQNTINDQEYPKEDGSNETETFYLAAGVQKLDGETALKFVRSRHGTGGEGSDFARSARQQQVLAAVKDQALASGLLTNPVKFVKALNIVGDNIRTDINTTEMKLLAEKLADINTDEAKTSVLSNSPEGLLTDIDNYPGYTLTPRAGDNDYSQVQLLMHSIAPDPLIKKEGARIKVVSTTSVKHAEKVADLLTNYGYNIVESGFDKKAKESLGVEKKNNFPYTLHYLENRYELTASNQRTTDGVDIELVVTE